MICIKPTYCAQALRVDTIGNGSRDALQKFLLDFCDSEIDIVCLELHSYEKSIEVLATSLRKISARCKLPVCVARRFNNRIYVWRKELLE